MSRAANAFFRVLGRTLVRVPDRLELARRLRNAQLSIFPGAGHGGIFQYHAFFVQQALNFLRQQGKAAPEPHPKVPGALRRFQRKPASPSGRPASDRVSYPI
jgi:hypothetical protein